MTDIDKAVQAIRDTAEAEIKKLLAAEEEDWKPGDNSYYVSGYGYAYPHCGCEQSEYHEMGNAYPTKELAEAAITRRKAYVKVTRLIAKLNREQGWVADWKDEYQGKYFIGITQHNNKLVQNYTVYCQTNRNELYGSRETINEIINNHSELYKVAMGWGE